MSDGISTPVGSVMLWAGGTDQAAMMALLLDGWVLCDGSAWDTDGDVADLFAVIGESYGGGAGQFCTPAYQGLFLRGATGTTDRDPDAGSRGAPRPDQPNHGNTGAGVGSVQPDGIEAHGHSYNYFNSYTKSTHTAGHRTLSGSTTSQMTRAGGAETRPINQYVNFVIKAMNNTDGVPPGAVLPYAGSYQSAQGLASAGWLPCDGAKLPTNTYPRLQRMISTFYGGDTDAYYLPDYRGRFLRGVQGQGIPNLPVADPDAATRTSPRPDLPLKGNLGNLVGSLQASTFADHTHDYTFNNDYWSTAATLIGPEERANDSAAWTSAANGNAAESRPLNIYANYIIKVT